MAYDLNSTDLAALHSIIRDQIAAQFPDLKTVDFYRDDESENIPTPACLLEMEGFEYVDEDPGTGQLGVALRFAARLLFSREKGADAPLQIRIAGAALAAFINKNRFGGRVSPGRIISGGLDFFRPDLTGRWAIWRIEWVHHRAFLGDNIWINNGSVPEATHNAEDGDHA